MAQRKTYTDKEKKALIRKVFGLLPDMSVREACKIVNLPISNLMRWLEIEKLDLHTDVSNKEQYTRAHFNYIEKLADEIISIADTDPKTLIETRKYGEKEIVKERIDTGDVLNRTLQINARKWLLSKLAPKRFAAKLELSSDPENPLNANTGNQYYNVVVNNYTKEEQNEIDKNIAAIHNRLAKS